MALSTEFGLEVLVAPIPGDNPAGRDLRASDGGDLRAIKDARNEARRLERQADNDGEEHVASLPYWRTVCEMGQTVLAEQSKDFEVASFLVEGLVRTSGFAGLAEGLHVLRALVQDFWDTAYPLPDPQETDEGTRITDRLLSVSYLNGQDGPGLLPPALVRIPIAEGQSVGPFAIWQYRQAVELAKKNPEEQERRVNKGEVNMEKFNRAVIESSPQFFVGLVDGLTASEAELKALDDALTEKCGSYSPSWSGVRQELEECNRVVRLIAKGKLPAETTAAAAGTNAGAADKSSSTSAAPTVAGELLTRDDAFRKLEEVAAFFERLDPQSLLAVQLRKVIRLGQLSPAEFYKELVEDETARERMFKLVGIAQQSSENSSF